MTKNPTGKSPGDQQPARPERPRARPMNAEARRRQLLARAVAETANTGLGHARHTDIAAAAGVSVPTVFHYFPTREDLADAVLDEVRRFLLDEIVADRQERDAPANELLAEILLAFATAIETHPDYVRVWLDWSTAVRAEYWPSYLRFHTRAMDLIGAIIDRGKREGVLNTQLDTNDEARVFIGIGHMVAHMKFAGNDAETIARTVRSFVEAYLMRGI